METHPEEVGCVGTFSCFVLSGSYTSLCIPAAETPQIGSPGAHWPIKGWKLALELQDKKAEGFQNNYILTIYPGSGNCSALLMGARSNIFCTYSVRGAVVERRGSGVDQPGFSPNLDICCMCDL